MRSEEHTSELQSRFDLVCRLLLEKKNRRNSCVNNKSIENGVRQFLISYLYFTTMLVTLLVIFLYLLFHNLILFCIKYFHLLRKLLSFPTRRSSDLSVVDIGIIYAFTSYSKSFFHPIGGMLDSLSIYQD